MYFKIQGTCFKIYALYFSRKTISDFQQFMKPVKIPSVVWRFAALGKAKGVLLC